MVYLKIFFLWCMAYFCTCSTFDPRCSIKRFQASKHIAGNQNKTYTKAIQKFNSHKLKIKVFYETLCPASVDFFITQLQPTVTSLGSHLDIRMVPYGNAETRSLHGLYTFRCQHGPAECYGNKLHACAIDVIKNNTKAVFYNACLMKYSINREEFRVDYTTALNWCGYKYNVPIRRVWKCANSIRGTRLLKYYGEQTQKVGLKFVPYVLLDNSSDMQDETTINLMAVTCKMLKSTPPACHIQDKQGKLVILHKSAI